MTPDRVEELMSAAVGARDRKVTVTLLPDELEELCHLAKAAIPSGQVAEDVKAVRSVFDGVDWMANGREQVEAATSRLAAKARGYEAAIEWIRVVSEELIVAGGDGGDRTVALANLRAMIKERDDAVADNAALLETLRLVGKSDGAWGPQTCTWCGCQQQHADRCPVGQALSQPHPGTALLEEMDTLRGVQAQAQVDAKFIHDAMGWAGEWPRSLPAPSRAVVALLEEHRKALETSERKTLCLVLDELGADGAAAFLGEATNEQLHKSIWAHVRWLETRARNEGLEKVSAYLRALMPEATIMPTTRNIVLKAAAAIDAMKEPE